MKKIKALKEKISKRELTIGSWLQISHPVVTDIMAQAGFEWLVVDLEHSVIGLSDMQIQFQVMEAFGIVPLVRLSENNQVEIKRVLDAGAKGIIVPNVNSAKDAKKAIESAKYPPEGARGVGIARAQGYGANFKEYFDAANELIVIVQIEHKLAVENINEILKNPIDGILIGPYDISASYGVAGDFEHPLVKEAVEKVKDAAIKADKPIGAHVVYPNQDEVLKKIKEGFTFIAYSTDAIILQDHTSKALLSLKEKVSL